MNTYTGEIKNLVTDEEYQKYTSDSPLFKAIDVRNLTERQRNQLAAMGRTRVSRNSPCPCGSRKRFKNCCYTGDQTSTKV